MNKKFLSTSVCAIMLSLMTTTAFAQPLETRGFDESKVGNQKIVSPQEKCSKKMERHQERKQKIMDLDNRLQLTKEQKAQIEKNREKSKKKLEAIKKKEIKLKKEKREIFEQNKKDFESILTPEQKEELKKIKLERAEKMKEFKGKKHHKQ